MKRFSVILSAPFLLVTACDSAPITKSWDYRSKAPSVSTPLVLKDRVYFGTEVGLDAINRKGGHVWRVDKQGMDVVGGPTFYKDTVLYGSTNGNFYAVTTKGTPRWEYATAARIKSDPTTHEGNVIFSSYDGHVYNMTIDKGKGNWRFPGATEEDLPGPPTLPVVAEYLKKKADWANEPHWATKMLTQESDQGDAEKINEVTVQCEEAKAQADAAGSAPPDCWRWRMEQLGREPMPPHPPSKKQIDSKCGKDAACRDLESQAWEWPPGDFAYSSPLVVPEENLVVLGNMDWHVYAIDLQSGKLRWRTRLVGHVTSTPVLHNGMIFIGSNGRLGGKKPINGKVYALDVKTGAVVSSYEEITNEVNSSAAIDGDDLYIGDLDGTLHAVDINTFKPSKTCSKADECGEGVACTAGICQSKPVNRWKFQTTGPIRGRPVIYKSLVFIGSGTDDQHMYAIKRSDGTVYWKYRTGGKIESDPVVFEDELFFTSADKKLYAFKIRQTP
ncbi:MAG: hypothetical protein CMH55_01575 [Myxococcales bacterium]|nr:hypothetical protein [Myxococcales bacterium]|tara:strand:+ start:1012 stop:2514 length:1503 start_codon:yes stop_codon:yes gene_type:complete